MRKQGLLGRAGCLLLLLAACQAGQPEAVMQEGSTAVPPIPTLDLKRVAQGKALYDQHCAACHGFQLEGQPDWKTQNEDGSFKAPPHNGAGHTWHHGDVTLMQAIREGGSRFADMDIGGTSPMPAYNEILTEAEMTAVLDYIKSTWPEDIRAVQWEVTVREKAQK